MLSRAPGHLSCVHSPASSGTCTSPSLDGLLSRTVRENPPPTSLTNSSVPHRSRTQSLRPDLDTMKGCLSDFQSRRCRRDLSITRNSFNLKPLSVMVLGGCDVVLVCWVAIGSTGLKRMPSPSGIAGMTSPRTSDPRAVAPVSGHLQPWLSLLLGGEPPRAV